MAVGPAEEVTPSEWAGPERGVTLLENPGGGDGRADEAVVIVLVTA